MEIHDITEFILRKMIFPPKYLGKIGISERWVHALKDPISWHIKHRNKLH